MKNMRRILEHALFWTLYWLVNSLTIALYDLEFAVVLPYKMGHMPLTILATYVFVYRILPLYFERKWGWLILFTLILFTVVPLLKRLLAGYVLFPMFYANSDWSFTFFNWYRIAGHLVELGTTTGLVAGLKFYRDLHRSKEKVEALSAEKRLAELSFLRAQIHPHFLFNTLNSIYYEVLKKSDNAPDLIIRLSGILRFILYECRDPFIPVFKEIKLIEDYIVLQKSRYGDRLTLDFKVQGETDRQVPPLICFSLIENAFKHGASENKENSLIEMFLEIGEDKLNLEVRNPIAEAAQPDVLGASKGIGLENITKQLSLIFEDRYTLTSTRQDGIFISRLTLPLPEPQPEPQL